ncbi:EAL and HDOD domain-containing protein [Sporolactobacillus terrae]|uniref:HDOD domain-containing protein n=1 Tax=Sporolactobacillus terrae TaxID=269673 RepID=A0A5K7X2G7_9BACL|nr:HDOD domain-containing protein [Sporolactobacillus terrae]BBN98823.1 hypothetical protein St703_15280 [Sporolactobacillus terrae]
MDIYVARQPIFDRKMKLYGYELLYRENQNNQFNGLSDKKATASLLSNSFLVLGFDELIEDTHGFINFPEEFLIQQLPRLLPQQKIIVEVLERVNPSEKVIEACRALKKDGYILALDDFVFDRNGYGPLIELADMIKIEFSRATIKEQLLLLQKYRGKKMFLAEKVETMNDYRLALAVGYDLFQGYFFSKPVIVNAKEIGYQETLLVRILKELHKKEPDLNQLTNFISADIGLAYKLLRAANTIQYGSKYPIHSIRQALSRIGAKEMIQWIHIMMIKGAERSENSELIKRSLIRGKLLELLACRSGLVLKGSNFFITGIFSSLDQILNQPMKKILAKLPLDQEVKDALMGKPNKIRIFLDAIVSFEKADWQAFSEFISKSKFTDEAFMELYLKAIHWQHSLNE